VRVRFYTMSADVVSVTLDRGRAYAYRPGRCVSCCEAKYLLGLAATHQASWHTCTPIWLVGDGARCKA
jgi:hypothetical protein